jgi:hypothetical protein
MWIPEENSQISAPQVPETLAPYIWLIIYQTIRNNGSTTYPNTYNVIQKVAANGGLTWFSKQYATIGTYFRKLTDPVIITTKAPVHSWLASQRYSWPQYETWVQSAANMQYSEAVSPQLLDTIR